MVKFKENTFVKGNYEELMEIAKAIEKKGAKVDWFSESEESSHLWYSTDHEDWNFYHDLNSKCDHELTKTALYQAYGIADFSILNEEDVFYIETKIGRYLYKGKNPMVECERVFVALHCNSVFPLGKGRVQPNKNEYRLIRLATTEEIEPYKKHFKLQNMEKKPKFKEGDTVRCIGETDKTTRGEFSTGWEKGKEFLVDRVKSFEKGDVYFPEEGYGVWEEHLELVATETRQIQITRETAVEWFNSTDETLKQLALTAFPELDESVPKAGDLCLFSDYIDEFNNNIGSIGELKHHFHKGKFDRKEGGLWKYCKKIKTIEFY